MISPETTLRLTVHGKVQGVFYRDWTVHNARELGLAGWVKNQENGTVAALLQGDAGAVQTMLERMQTGPSAARVERIERHASAAEPLASFERR